MTSIFGGVDATRQALDYHLERHNVLASNVANVDTPGFRPRELVRSSEEGVSGSLPMAATTEAHFGTTAAQSPGEVVTLEEQVVTPGADGNSVSLEREMSKIAANDLRYDGAAKIVARQLAMLRYAANDGVGG